MPTGPPPPASTSSTGRHAACDVVFMIQQPSAGLAPRPLAERLMIFGLGFWGVGIGGAYLPRVLRSMLYPGDPADAHLDLVAAPPVGSAVVWIVLVAWCVSWAFVAGYLTRDWAGRRGRPAWATPALLLLSLASPLVLGFAFSVLVRLATHGDYHGSGVVPFLPAVLLQVVISQGYAFMTAGRPRAEMEPRAGALTAT